MSDKLSKELLTAYRIHSDNEIWEQIKQQILLTARFDAREWELEIIEPKIVDGFLAGKCRLVAKKKGD